MRRMVLHKVNDLGKYVELLAANPAEVDGLFNDLLINVTSFFRDARTFQTLKKKVFPRLMKAHPDDSPLRMWVCGCATGEEAYSLAMTLVEFFEETRTHLPAQIFATDISDGSIGRARAGTYPESIRQDVSAARLRRFFTKMNGHYLIHKSIRDMCIFARQNVTMDPPFLNLDLIACRNVLIYFGPVLQRRVMPLFHYALRPEGFLVLGTSETIGTSTEYFAPLDSKQRIYRKKLGYARAGLQMVPRAGEGKAEPQASAPPKPAERKGADLQQQADKLLLRDFAPPAVVIDSEMQVLQFRGDTGDYLEHHAGLASLNLLKMARDNMVMALRTVVNKAKRENRPVAQTGIEIHRRRRTCQITIEVVPFEAETSDDRFFLVVFREENVVLPSTDGGTKGGRRASGDPNEAARLRQELSATKESLKSIIEDQDTGNEELKAANEEIQSSNEELQSTNEELETAKEELQSTNEELTTLNEELQTSNTQLGLLNNDLTNLLGSVNVAILMVDNNLNLRRFTPMAERLLDLIPSDAGRPLTFMNRGVLGEDLAASVRHVIDSLTPIEREATDETGHWYLLRIRPYRTRENKIEGAVILLIDINDIRRALDAVLDLVKQPLLLLGADLRVRNANEAFRATFGVGAEQVVGKMIYEAGEGKWDVPTLRKLLEEVLPLSKQVKDFEIEASFPKVGKRNLRLNGSRFFDESQTIQLILLAIEDVT